MKTTTKAKLESHLDLSSNLAETHNKKKVRAISMTFVTVTAIIVFFMWALFYGGVLGF